VVRTVLVTGANSGIGLEIALHTAALGFRVVGTARSDEKADVLAKAASDAGVAVETMVLDVTDAVRCRTVVGELEPWAVVNNAGYMNVGKVVDVPAEEALEQLHALVVAPMRLATLAIPSMRRRGDGRIVNVSSVTAYTTAAMTGWYQASKHALSAVTDALRREVAVDGVDVVSIEPGGMRTGIWDKADDDLARRQPGSTSPDAYRQARRLLRASQPRMGDPAKVAAVVGEALTAGRPKPRYRVGADAPVVVLLDNVLPERAKMWLTRAAMDD
jgi:NAD(P)-dependent dehydrogenase (short-subunit alcohol dehydrogenase family)